MTRNTKNKTRKPPGKKSASQNKRSGEGRVAALEERIEALERELEIHRTLGEFDEVGVSAERVLGKFLSMAMRFFGTSAGTVFFLDSDSGTLDFRVVRGRARNKLKSRRLELGEGIAGWVVRHGKPRLVRDVQADPQWKGEIAREVGFPTKDILAVPLRGRSGKLTGVIELLNSKKHAGFRRRDLDQLVALAGPVGNLVENVLLLSEDRRRNMQLRLLNQVSHVINSTLDPKEVRRRTIDAAMRLVDCEAASLLLPERGSDQLYFEVALGEQGGKVKSIRLKAGEGIAGWVIEHGKPVVIQDCSQDSRWSGRVDAHSRFTTRDMVCVPVKIKGRTSGAIQALNKRSGRFDREDMNMLGALADKVAVALENARLFDELQQTFLETSEALAEAIELRDAYTGGHTRRVTTYSLATGRELGLDEKDMTRLRMAAILHDIGKLGVDDRVLRKPGRLDHEEFEQMKRHPRLGAEILEPVHYLGETLSGIRSHHERNDGLGYPDGLRGRHVPLLARIIAVADTYDAMTSDRPYRKGLAKSVAIQELIDCSGTQFEPRVVDAFLEAFRKGGITGKREKTPAKTATRRGRGRAPAGSRKR